VLNVIPGYGPEAGEPLGRHPDVDKIAFTGSVEVGRRFLRYAGESNGKVVSLELGGKSPHVVLADVADLDAAAETIGWGIFYNAGQTCHAGSRVVVQEPVAEELTSRLVDFAARLRPGDPADPGTQLGALVSAEHLSGVLARVEAAAADGARLLVGGRRAEPVAGGAYMLPTVLEAPEPDSPLVQEEVFGPVLAVQRARDVADAVALANGTSYGLAAAVWTREVSTAHRVARRLRAGTVWVNTFDASSLATPFGGFKASGQGRDRSLHALESYTQLKTTWVAL
jgi:gamma-glutamyl-gamma-aminobutyraldehyde dehydrogenase/4-guanidinobutyraldehyde dehydrogenase/NAD-dependent aldehyde dehydrogenase